MPPKRHLSCPSSPPSASRARYSMDVGEPTVTQQPSVQLEVVPEDPLAKFNDQINDQIIAQTIAMDPSHTADNILGSLIEVVSEYKGVSLEESYLKFTRRVSLFEKYNQLEAKILNAWEKKDFKPIRTLQILHKNPPNEDTWMAGTPSNPSRTAKAFMDATEQSWNRDFIGSAAAALWEHIMHYYKDNQPFYANYVAIVQSSGTGKSRTIDELSKTVLTIPLCLRLRGTTGYPYADDEVRDFLRAPQNKNDAYLHAIAFLLALVEHIENTLRSGFHTMTKYSDVAVSFRQHMTSNQRRVFFHTVVNNAKRYSNQCSSPDAPSSIRSFSLENEMIDRMSSAWTSLQSLLENKSPSVDGGPILLIAWDEAHTLTNKGSDSSWSHFTALRRVLNELVMHPIFSIFSSTTSRISHFSPASASDDSSRVVERSLTPIPPFCDFGRDLFPIKLVSVDAGQTLDEFTTDKYMCHLGRPLFGSHYDCVIESVRNDLLEFAAHKLVRDVNQIPLPSALSPIQKIACLSFRLPIQFNSTVYTSRDHEASLVKGHMRVCLKVDASREFMNTLSASEPFMSEAAYVVSNRHGPALGRKVAVDAFRLLTEGFGIHAGDRGEFLALLLFTLARDATVGSLNASGHPATRHFGLADFLCKNLIHDALASLNSKDNLELLRKGFPHAVMHFNHFIKAHQQSIITQENLLKLMARGAGLLCANCQPGIDFILPFLVNGLQMAKSNSGFILVQVKNDRHTADIQAGLFDNMNPYKLKILEANQAAVPLIRIVFALAAARPSVNVLEHKPSTDYNALIYDIWVAGITPEVLHPIDSDLQETWKAVLQASYGWKHLFDTGPVARDIRMSTDAGSAEHDAHWNRWSK